MVNKPNINRKRINWKRVVLLAILVFLALWLIISLIVGLFTGGSDDTSSIYTIGNLNAKQTLSVIEEEDRSQTIEVTDYNFYGESLNLYLSTYDRNDPDSLAGETIVLVDLLSENSYEFEIGTGVDDQIMLGNLTEGFYSVYVKGDETNSRVYMSTRISSNNSIYTVTRNNTRYQVELIANKALFDEENATESVLDNHYLYIKVTQETTKEAEETASDIDVIINVAPALTSYNVSQVGESDNGIVEYDELIEVATEIQTQLESNGLKVLLVDYNSTGEKTLYYGTDGVAYQAYANNAKYMLYLDMTNLDYEIGTVYSNYSDGVLAEYIYDSLASVGLYNDKNDQLYDADVYNDSLDGTYYDGEYEIRETGGAVLGAGSYSESSQENATFASNNIFGVNTIKIVTTNIYSSTSVETWNSVKSNVASAIVEGFMSYLSEN